ncbi:hypothetical protein Tco_1317200 [Tanacetum coccineum]
MQITHVAKEAATMPHDSPLLRVHSLGSDEGSMTLNELTFLYTTLSKKVETLESNLKQTKLTYGAAYTKLIMKVKKLEHKGRHEPNFEEFDFEFIAPEEDYTTEPDISTANIPVRTAGEEVSTASPEVKTAAKIQKKTKLQLEQERLGLEEALRLQKQLDDEERLQAQERERYFEPDKTRLPVELINERKRKFTQQRVEQRRNKPMTQAQQRTYMFKELFEYTMKRVNTFTPIESDDKVPKVVVGSLKRNAEQELNQESSKRQKIGEGSEPAKESKDELS